MTAELVLHNGGAMTRDRAEYDASEIDLIKKTVANGASDLELKLFLYQCKRTGLDPLARQIYWIKRGDKGTIQTSIDGFRLIADRTGQYCGNDDAVFTMKEGDKHPVSATVTVYKMVGGVRCPFTATARWSEYYPGERQGTMWNKMPHTMLGKCAESLALRKAFPADLSGLYTMDEMAQANNTYRAQPGAVDPQTGEILDGLPGPATVARNQSHDAEADEAAASHDTGKKRTSTADANEKGLRKQGILSHKGWMTHNELDPEDKDLSRHLLSLALDAPVASRADLTGEQWQKANTWLGKLDTAALLGLVDAHRQVRELSDPFAEDSDVVDGALV